VTRTYSIQKGPVNGPFCNYERFCFLREEGFLKDPVSVVVVPCPSTCEEPKTVCVASFLCFPFMLSPQLTFPVSATFYTYIEGKKDSLESRGGV
jgi:hypothetical protein